MRVLLVLFWLFAVPLSAQASPWPRAQGGWFFASSLGQERVAAGWRHYGEFYAEYGATAQLTLATQLRPVASGWRGDLLARWHPGAASDAPPIGLGIGLRFQGRADRALLLFAAHFGLGLDTRLGNVWARLDLQMQSRPTQPASPVELSLSGQLGFRHAQGILGMVSITGKRRNGTTALELSPAIGYELTPARTVVLGLTASPSTPRIRRAQLSLWSRF